MGNWWANKKVLVSPRWIERISWSESTVFVGLSSEAIKQVTDIVRGMETETRSALAAMTCT